MIFWFLFHLIWKNYVLYWDFDLKSCIVDFFTRFTREKTPQNNFSSQNISVENNYSRADTYFELSRSVLCFVFPVFKVLKWYVGILKRKYSLVLYSISIHTFYFQYLQGRVFFPEWNVFFQTDLRMSINRMFWWVCWVYIVQNDNRPDNT